MQGKIPQQMHNDSRVTREMVESSIASEHYFTAADGVEGAELLRRLHEVEDAIRQLWSLLHYELNELKSQLYRENEATEKPEKVKPNYVFPQDITQRADRAGCGAAPAASSTEGATGQASGKKETNYSVYDPFSVQGIIK